MVEGLELARLMKQQNVTDVSWLIFLLVSIVTKKAMGLLQAYSRGGRCGACVA